MKAFWFLNGKRISVKNVREIVGDKKYKTMLNEAKESFSEDTYIDNSWIIGDNGILSVKFS